MGAIERNVRAFWDDMLTLTVKIVKVNEVGALQGWASGFLYQPDASRLPLVITAGHKTPPLGCFIETSIVHDDKLLCLNAGEFQVFHRVDEIDYAFSQLQPADVPARAAELTVYQHRFVRATAGEAYGFATVNNLEFIRNGTGLLLQRYECSEAGMELQEEGEHISLFRTATPIQPHAHYQGASGAPVANAQREITGILVGGTTPEQYLKVCRLDNIKLPGA